jgi:branched-chain amino acid transport system permease protein
LERQGASEGAHLISSLGIFIIIVQCIALAWGNETKVLRSGVGAALHFGKMILTPSQVIAGGTAFATIGAFFLWLRFSNVGLQFRALSDNPIQLALFGYNTRRVRLLAFGIGGFLCAIAAMLVSYDIGFDPHGGLHALLLAVVAVIIGGRHSFVGAVLGAMIVGVVRSEVVWFLSARWQEAITFGLLALFLYVAPNGLMGRTMRLEAQA